MSRDEKILYSGVALGLLVGFALWWEPRRRRVLVRAVEPVPLVIFPKGAPPFLQEPADA